MLVSQGEPPGTVSGQHMPPFLDPFFVAFTGFLVPLAIVNLLPLLGVNSS